MNDFSLSRIARANRKSKLKAVRNPAYNQLITEPEKL